MPLLERLLTHTTITAHGLLWTGSINVRTGYGQIRAKRADGTWTVRLVHRVWYEHLYGEIPTGYDVDHKCRIRYCLTHIRLLPVRANRGSGRWVARAHRLRLDSERRFYAGKIA